MKKFLVIALGFIWSLKASAQAVLVAEYTFTGDLSTPSLWNSVLLSSAGSMYAGPGLANVGYVNGQFAFPDRAKWATNWSLVVLDLNDHFGVVLTPAFGFDLVVDSVSFKIRRSSTAPDTIEFRESYTGAFAFHWKAKTGPADAWRRFSITSGFITGSGPIDLRVYGRNAIGLGGAMRIDDFRVYAHLVANGLPIELLSFTGQAVREGVELEWRTASETNNEYFSVYRRFESDMTWNKVGRVEGAGNSQTEIRYGLLDENPANGVNYYRLHQTDFNGDSTVSNVVPVRYQQPFGMTTTVGSTISWHGLETTLTTVDGKIIGKSEQHFMSEIGIFLLYTRDGDVVKLIVLRD